MEALKQVYHWCLENWPLLVLAAAVVAKVLNKVTAHWSERKGLVRWCLFLIDLLDLVKVTPRRDVIGGTIASPELRKTPPGNLGGADAQVLLGSTFVGLALLGLLALFGSGCSSVLSSAQSGVEKMWAAAYAPITAECRKLAEQCKGKVAAASECLPWVACDALRARLDKATKLASSSLGEIAAVTDEAVKLGLLKVKP